METASKLELLVWGNPVTAGKRLLKQLLCVKLYRTAEFVGIICSTSPCLTGGGQTIVGLVKTGVETSGVGQQGVTGKRRRLCKQWLPWLDGFNRTVALYEPLPFLFFKGTAQEAVNPQRQAPVSQLPKMLQTPWLKQGLGLVCRSFPV